MNRITKIAVQVECNGKPYAVDIDQDNAELAAHMLSAFCKDGKLQLIGLPAGCAFAPLGEILKEK